MTASNDETPKAAPGAATPESAKSESAKSESAKSKSAKRRPAPAPDPDPAPDDDAIARVERGKARARVRARLGVEDDPLVAFLGPEAAEAVRDSGKWPDRFGAYPAEWESAGVEPDDLRPRHAPEPETEPETEPDTPPVDPASVHFYLTQAGYIGLDIDGVYGRHARHPALRPRPIDIMVKDMLLNEMMILNEVDAGGLAHLYARLQESLTDVGMVLRKIDASDWWRPYTGAGARGGGYS